MNDTAHFARVTRRSVEDEVYARTRQAILAGAIAGGERLVHDDLAERFGTSRIPVRDALKRLHTDGLVEGARRGYRVAKFGRAEIVELYALRALLEARAAAQAALRIDPAELKTLQADHDSMAALADARDREGYVEINQRFHSRIYTSAGQPRQARIIAGLWRGLPPLTPISAAVSLTETIAEHAAILAALARGDGEAASAAVERHVVRARDELLAHIDDTGRLF